MQQPQVILNESGSHAFVSVGHSAAVIKTNFSAASASPDYPGAATPTQPVEKLTSSGDVAVWGDDNLFPQTVITELRKNTIIQSTLEWKARALYSAGLMYGEVTGYDSNGNETFQRVKDPVIDDFFRRSNIKRYLIESCIDFYYFYNTFPELILSKDGGKIVSIQENESEDCRWGKRNSLGQLGKCYISANWKGNSVPDDATIIPVIDPYYDAVGNVQRSQPKKFIYPVSFPVPGCNYYQLAAWNSIRSSEWYDVAQAIPQFKKALFNNQFTIKYHIEVATWFWPFKYKEWGTLKAEKQRELMQTECDNFIKLMAGAENSGKALMTHFIAGDDGKERPAWKITAIDDKVKDGMYIEDSQEASSHLLYALGVHPTLMGAGPGRNNVGAGSGSDQRVAFNNYISLCEPHRDIVLEPLNFIRDYNGWNPNIEFRFRIPMIMTLETGSQTSTQPSTASVTTKTA